MSIEYIGQRGTDGVSLGQTASDLVSLHGATPTDQGAAITAPAATAATNSSPYGYSQAQADAILTAVRSIITVLEEKGIIATS